MFLQVYYSLSRRDPRKQAFLAMFDKHGKGKNLAWTANFCETVTNHENSEEKVMEKMMYGMEILRLHGFDGQIMSQEEFENTLTHIIHDSEVKFEYQCECKAGL
jgi:hypothetical protein